MYNSDKIRTLRTKLGLTQPELAARANVSIRALASLEAGDARPRLETLERVATALGVSVRALLRARPLDGGG